MTKFLCRLALVCAVSLLTGAAAAQTYDDALDDAGDELAASLGRHGFGPDKSVGIARFLGSAGVACEPLASILTQGLRRMLIHHTERMGVHTNVVEDLSPGSVTAVVSGRWYRSGGDKTRLTLKLGDVTDMTFTNIAAAEVTFETASLPPDARRCVLELEPIEREITADRTLIAREAPYSIGKKAGEIAAGKTVWVSAKVLSEGAEDWFVVRLPDDQEMPMGMRERHAFVYALTLPEDLMRQFKVAEMDAPFLISETVKVRAEPTARSEQLDTYAAGTVVQVTGKVADRDWVRILWRGDDAYVYAPVLKEVDAGEAAAWNKVKDSKDARALNAFLDDWPKGALAALAKKRLAALGPPPLAVRVWTEKKRYRAGEFIRIFLEGNKDFYARMVYRDAEGNLIQLLPNAYRGENRFGAGLAHAVPNDSDRFDLEVGPPFGNERIIVFASTAPLGEISGEDIGGGLGLLRGSEDDIRRQSRGVHLKEKDPAGTKREFHESFVGFTTGP